MLYKKTIITLLITGYATLLAMPALAGGTVNDYAAEVSQDTSNFPNIVAFICYMIGIVLAALGVYGMKQHVEQGQNAPLKNQLAKLGVGGFFLAFPAITGVIQNTSSDSAGPSGGGDTADNISGGTLGQMVDAAVNNTSALPDVVAYLSYMVGILFVAVALYKFKNHIEFGPQSVPLADPLKFFFAGGLALSLPFVSAVAVNTFGDDGMAQDVGWDNSGATSGTPGTLDDMMVRFVSDMFGPITNLFMFFCYVAGAVLMLIAVHRFTKTAQDGPRGPTGLGTVATFMLAGVLFSIAPIVGVLTETLFGVRDSMTEVSFLALEDGGVNTEHAERVTVAVLAFLIIVGILSIIRGLFVLRGVAEGNQQMTMMGGVSHLIAGAILVNFGQFAMIIQETLGIAEYGVLFN